MNYDTESVLLLDRNSRLVSTVLTLDDTPRKLNAIWELAFTNDKSLIYTGGTYLKKGTTNFWMLWGNRYRSSNL